MCETKRGWVSQGTGFGRADVSGFPAEDVEWGACRTVLAMAAALDWAVGEIVDALHATSLYDNTVIFYSSDNGAQPGQGGTSYPLRGFKTMLYEGGIRVPGFVSGGSSLLPAAVRGTTNHKLYHVVDWLPTIVKLCGGDTTKNLALDGVDIWPSLTSPDAAVPSERNEVLVNINPACGKGFVNPNAGLRVGDWKILVDCFNTTTLAPNPQAPGGPNAVELYNIAADPYETDNLAPTEPAKVQELLARLAVYANSTDQVPPTLFWPFAGPTSTGANGQRSVAPWNYQCPQCCHHGALPGPEGFHFDPWCDNVACGVGPPAVCPNSTAAAAGL